MLSSYQRRKFHTLKDYIELPDSTEGDRYELVRGKLLVREGASELHARINARLIGYIGNMTLKNKLGQVYGSELRYQTTPPTERYPTIRHPSVSFISADRVTRGVEVIEFGPDLAVEVVSPSDKFLYFEAKIKEYFALGGRLVWVIQPTEQLVHIYRAGSQFRQTLTANDELDGENVLPGFKLKVTDLFA